VVGVPHFGHPGSVHPGHELLNATALAELDGGALFDASAHRPLDQGPRHGVRVEPKIPLRERIEARALHSHIEPGTSWHCSGANEIALEPRE
jgi:hypothetical protein